jgi:hypothetical protein
MNELTPQPLTVAPPAEATDVFKPKLGKAYIVPTGERSGGQPIYRRVGLPSSKYRPHIGEKQVAKRINKELQ